MQLSVVAAVFPGNIFQESVMRKFMFSGFLGLLPALVIAGPVDINTADAATIAERANVNTNRPAIAAAARRMTRLFGKSWNQMVKIVTRAPLGRLGGLATPLGAAVGRC